MADLEEALAADIAAVEALAAEVAAAEVIQEDGKQ